MDYFNVKKLDIISNFNYKNPCKKTWESPEITKWEIDENLKNLPAGPVIDGIMFNS